MTRLELPATFHSRQGATPRHRPAACPARRRFAPGTCAALPPSPRPYSPAPRLPTTARRRLLSPFAMAPPTAANGAAPNGAAAAAAAAGAVASVVEVLKSPADKKDYRYLKLPNGMAVLLIHDPEVAAAVAAGEQGDAEMASEDGSGSSGSEGDGEGESEEEGEEEDSEGSSMSEGATAGASGSGSMEEDEGESDEGESEEGEEGEEEEEDDSEEGGGGKRRGGPAPAASKRAAAAMAVGVGSFSDPRDLQGLSHYLEHMLFMGSERFPDENDYDAYLTRHGGSSNAYTELEYTNYHFEVAPAHLKGALDRFAQFFVAPLCKQSAMEREVCAVDSEFSGVLQDDHSRLCQLMCHTSKPGHVFTKFSWGNKKSLWDGPSASGVDVRSRLLDYYKQHYGAERMCLAVLGGQSLEEMEGWVRDLFSPVPPGRCGPAATFESEGPPFEGRTLHVAPAVKEHHEVTVTFQLPPLRKHYATKPDHYISHLVGHEGPGSLLSALKARGWATDLCAGVEDDGYGANSCCYLFSVAMTLTEAGLAAGPGLGLAPVGLLFQYMRLLIDAAPQEWVWQELKAIADMKFRFLEDEDACDYVTRLAATLGVVSPQHVLAADWLHEAWEPEKVKGLLAAFDPVKAAYRVDLLTTAFGDIKGRLLDGSLPKLGNEESSAAAAAAKTNGSASGVAATVFTEPWFGMEAASAPLPEALTREWSEAAVSPDLGLPPRNPYIPSDFSLCCDALNGPSAPAAAAAAASKKGAKAAAAAAAAVAAAPAGEVGQDPDAAAAAAANGLPVVLAAPPTLLIDELGLRLWHKMDRRFRQPRAHCYVRLASSAGYASPRAAALTALWLRLVEDALNEDAYLADVAGLHYHTSPEGFSGVELRVDGFSDKLPMLAEKLVNTAARCAVRPESFGRVHEALARKLRNANMAVSKAANYLRLYALQADVWHVEAVGAEMPGITSIEEVQAFAATFMATCHVEVLLLGNISAPAASALARTLHAAAGPGAALSAAARPAERCVRLPVGRALSHTAPAKNGEEENCCVEVYYQVGPANDVRLRAMLDLVDQIVYEPCYDTLRTKQQLGYTVHSGTRLTHGVLGFCVVVVSAAYGVDHVEGRIEAFLAGFRETLQSLSQEEFDRHRTALTSNKLTRDAAIGQEGDRAWDAIWGGRHDFLSREQEVEALRRATREEVAALFDEHLWPLGPWRRKLAVRVVPRKGAAAAAAAAVAGGGKGGGAAAGAQHAQQHVHHAHPHLSHGGEQHVAPGSPKKGAAAAAARGGAGGKGPAPASAAAASDDPAAAPVPRIPVPTEEAPDIDELKRSLPTYPAALSLYPAPPGPAQQHKQQ